MISRIKSYFGDFADPHFKRSLLWSLFLLLASGVVNFYAGVYATDSASSPVTDIILSNTRVHDVDGIFVYGSWVLVAFIGYLCARKPRQIPFIFKSISLFVIIRSIFISLTHIGPFPTEVVINPSSFIHYFVFGGDLFFSGHTGLPFLMALIFWNERWLRWTFLVTSLFFGVIVLLAHLHYTIDVLSAFFISYGIFHMALKFFAQDRALFISNS